MSCEQLLSGMFETNTESTSQDWWIYGNQSKFYPSWLW